MTISNMCRNTIRREDAESAVKTPRHGGSQSCRSCPQQTAMTLKEMEVKNLSSDKKTHLSLNNCNLYNKRTSMQQNEDSTSFLTSSLHVFIFLWNSFAKFHKLYAPKASSLRSSSVYSQSSFPLRFILLTFCILSGKLNYIIPS